MYGEIIDDIRLIMTEYFRYWKSGKTSPEQGKRLRFIPIESGKEDVRYTEHEFEIDLAPDIKWKGQIDGLGKTTKAVWLIETKTFDNLPTDDVRWRNLQTVTYREAAIRMGWVNHLDGVCWNYVRSKSPGVPQLLKDGSRLSKQAIITFPSIIEDAIKTHKLNRNDHQSLIDSAEHSLGEYFQRIFTPFNEEISKKIFEGFVETAKKMRDDGGKDREKNMGRHCGWCEYEPICRAEFTDGDIDFIKEREYEKTDPESYRRNNRVTHSNTRKPGSSKLRLVRPKRNG